MTKKNWYWIALVLGICLIYRANCAPATSDNATGRFTFIDDLVADIRDDDGRCL